jgi:hypothetical protein
MGRIQLLKRMAITDAHGVTSWQHEILKDTKWAEERNGQF